MRKFLVVSVLFSLSFLVDIHSSLSGFLAELHTARSVQAATTVILVPPTETTKEKHFPAGSSVSSIGCNVGLGSCIGLPES